MVKILHKHKEVKRKIISMKNSPFLPILYVWFRIDNLLWVHCCFSISPMLYHKPLIVIQFFTLMILFQHLGVNKIKTAQTVNSNFEGFFNFMTCLSIMTEVCISMKTKQSRFYDAVTNLN